MSKTCAEVIEHKVGGLASAGLVPYFFLESAVKNWPEPPTLKEVADSMDDLYGYGGFMHPFGGEIVDGRYISAYEEDEPLDPLVSITCGDITMLFYVYSITALVDAEGNSMIGRFD